jgi:hypothetical protein
LDDDLRALAMGGVHVLASLLEPHEEQELGLEREAALCASNGLAFVSVPIPDLAVPADFSQFASVRRGSWAVIFAWANAWPCTVARVSAVLGCWLYQSRS